MQSIAIAIPQIPPNKNPAVNIIGRYVTVAGDVTPPAVNERPVAKAQNEKENITEASFTYPFLLSTKEINALVLQHKIINKPRGRLCGNRIPNAAVTVVTIKIHDHANA